MKRMLPLLVLTIIFSTSSCMKAMIKSMLTSTPLGNKTLMHKNPKVGDYCVWKDEDGTKITQTIIAVDADTVTYTNIHPKFDGLSLEAVCDFDGNVKKVDIVDIKTKERTLTKIAQPGQTGYMNWKKFDMDGVKAAIPAMRIAAGIPYSGKTDYEIEGYSMNIQGSTFTMIYLVHKDIKFLQLAAFSMYQGNLTKITEYVESGNK